MHVHSYRNSEREVRHFWSDLWFLGKRRKHDFFSFPQWTAKTQKWKEDGSNGRHDMKASVLKTFVQDREDPC